VTDHRIALGNAAKTHEDEDELVELAGGLDGEDLEPGRDVSVVAVRLKLQAAKVRPNPVEIEELLYRKSC